MTASDGVAEALGLQNEFIQTCGNGGGVPDLSQLGQHMPLDARIRYALRERIAGFSPELVVPVPGFRIGRDAVMGMSGDKLLRFNPNVTAQRDICAEAGRIVVTAGILDPELSEVLRIANSLGLREDQLAVAGVWDVCAGAPRENFTAPIASVFPMPSQ